MSRNHLIFDKKLEQPFNKVLITQLPIVAFLMATMYLVFSVVHIFLMPVPIKSTLALITGFTALIYFGFSIKYRKVSTDPRYVQTIAVILFSLALFNSYVHLYLTLNPEQTTNFNLLIISTGLIFFSKRWYFIATSCALGFWLYCFFKVTWNISWIHYSLSIVISSVVSMTIFLTRIKIYTQIETQNQLAIQYFNEIEKNESLTKAVQQRDDFISLTSHELKTPLTSLKLQIQLLNSPLMREGLDAKILNLLKEADKQIDRVNRLVTDLLDLSKISHGKLELLIEKVDLFELLQDIVSRFSKTINSNLTIDFSNPQYAVGCWDRLRVEQVMNNLLSNAAKYGLGKPIRIFVDASEKEVLIQVRDFGIGIALEDQIRIFERFERAAAPNAVFGFGLGLYISRQIVQAHQGTIHVNSSPNDGSTFYVKLPRTLCQDLTTHQVA